MSMLVKSVTVDMMHNNYDVTVMGGQRELIAGPASIEFEIRGWCGPDDMMLLQELVFGAGRNGLDLLRVVAACEWCGALYPKSEDRCRKGCGGPRTKK